MRVVCELGLITLSSEVDSVYLAIMKTIMMTYFQDRGYRSRRSREY
jgi:hypothetical protein